MTLDERQQAGRRLKAKRIERGLKQLEVVADPKLGISVGTLQAIENAWYPVRDTNFEKYARYFGTTITKLLRENDPKPVEPSDPLLKDLNEEHLDIARQYMRARKRVRTAIEVILTHPDEDHLTAIVALAAALHADALARLRRMLESKDESMPLLELMDQIQRQPMAFRGLVRETIRDLMTQAENQRPTPIQQKKAR